MQKMKFRFVIAVLLCVGLLMPKQALVQAKTYTVKQFSWKAAAQGQATVGVETEVYFAMDKNLGFYAGSFTVSYDTSKLRYKGVSMVNQKQGVLMVDNESTKGTVSVAFVSSDMLRTKGNMVAVHFIPLKKGAAHVEISKVILTDPDMEDLAFSGKKGADLTVKDLSKPAVTVQNDSKAVRLDWKKITGADGYYIYRKDGKGNYKRLAKIGKNTTVSYKDKTAKAGKTYTYMVKAYNSVQTGEGSKAKSICYLAPSALSGAKNVSLGIRLEWKKTTGAGGYYIYRKTGNGAYKKIATVKGAKKVTYTDKKVTNKKKYTYKVIAYNGKSAGTAKNTKSLTRKKPSA